MNFNSNAWQAIIHGLKVAAHIAVAIIVTGVVYYIKGHPLPLYALVFTGAINTVLASLWHYSGLPAQDMPTIDTAPPTPPTPAA